MDASIQNFINLPDTVGFVVRGSSQVDRLIRENPNIIATQTLAGRYVVCYANSKAFMSIVDQMGTSYISSTAAVLGLLGRTELESAGIIQMQQQPILDLKGQGVLIGFVDTGIDYTQPVFRYEDGTSKIRYLYDQTAIGTPPEDFFIGTEYTNEQINRALKAENPYEIVPQRDTVGHGTFLASVAAGRETGDFIGAAPDAELIVVKLKKARQFELNLFAVPAEQENAYSNIAVMIGVEYIIKRAREMDRPVVICLGIGTNSGRHDGFSIFEEYLSGVANMTGICLCVAAGNESQARHHFRGKVQARGEVRNMEVMVGESRTDFFISIWSSVSDKISVSLLSPSGEFIDKVPPKTGSVHMTDLLLERASVRVAYYFPLEGSGGQLTAVRVLSATPGIWTITVNGDIILDGTFDAWLPLTGFVSPAVEFLSADPYCTITVPSTTTGAISCGAYDSANSRLDANSSWGPTQIDLMSPDLVAPGVNVAGIYPTGPGTMSGTSVATAVTAGACALMMQWGIVMGNDDDISTYQIRAYLIRGCNRNETMSYPNTQWGYGTLNLFQTFQMMRET